MKKNYLIIILILAFTSTWGKPLQNETIHSIIIDTDCAIDDMRAISLLLSLPNITIKGILLSDGSLPPNEGFVKVKALLHAFNHDSIPIACGKTIQGLNPTWREFNRHIRWGSGVYQVTECNDANGFLATELKKSDEKITLLCLGTLTNIAKTIHNDSTLLKKIDRIIWYNESAKPLQGFNYECDKKAAEIVLASKVITVVISNLNKPGILFDTSLYQLCLKQKTVLASIIGMVHSQPEVLKKLKQGHFRLCDELAAIYLTNPELFQINILPNQVRYNYDYSPEAVKEVLADMLKGEYVRSENVVFNPFPYKRTMFAYDVRQIMDSAIAHFGPEEWKACVMTDEFHGHLGLFSIVGAKMGIKARELFGVGPDLIEVVSYAGTKPPYSCMNDGIQVSTGATLGQGTIHIISDSITKPQALFTYNKHSYLIKLKDEYLFQVNAEIQEGIHTFGLIDEGYWIFVRRSAIKYWLNWDRNKIFDIQKIN
jgi:pyrimidine-specific ribonucleoside hydrolase